MSEGGMGGGAVRGSEALPSVYFRGCHFVYFNSHELMFTL